MMRLLPGPRLPRCRCWRGEPAGDQSSVGRSFRRFVIQVEGLRIELPGKSDDFTLGQHRALADEALADLEIVEIASRHFTHPKIRKLARLSRIGFFGVLGAVDHVVVLIQIAVPGGALHREKRRGPVVLRQP